MPREDSQSTTVSKIGSQKLFKNMSLDLHPSARKHFNEIAESLVKMVQLHPESDDGPTDGPDSLEESLQPEIQEADVEERGVECKVDGLTGEEVARYFRLDGDRFGLDDEEYKEFDDLVDRVTDRKEIKDKVSRQYIRDKTFEWIEKQYTGEYSSLQYTEFLLSEFKGVIEEHRVHMPIRYLLIDEPIQLGEVLISYLREELFDNLEEHYQSNFPDRLERVEEIKDEYQGQVTASLEVEAEEQRAIEVAKEEIEKTLAFLRFFSPSAIMAEVPSRWNVREKPTVVWTHFLVSTDGEFPNIVKMQDRYVGQKGSQVNAHWTIDQQQIFRFRELGIVHGHELLQDEKPGEIKDLIVNCILLFNKSLLERQRRDRLVFLMVCLETLLLKNSGEPIQKSLGQRLAVLKQDRKLEKQREIIDLVKDMYSERSDYVHHGKKIDLDMSKLSKFQRVVWQAVHYLLINRKNYDTKNGFIEELESRLLS